VDTAQAALGEQNRIQGGFAEAVVGAIAAAAGLSCYKPDLDLGFDRILESPSGEIIRLQIKSTSSQLNAVKGNLRYDLDVEAYERLRKLMTVRSYLVLVEVRSQRREWVVAMDWGFIVRRRAHYLSLRGGDPTTNKSTVTVSVPVENRVTPSSLADLMEGGA
jgi:hypothetical protein